MTGTCKYCGQTVILPDNFPGNPDDAAGNLCTCDGARFEQDLKRRQEELQRRREKAKFTIETLFGPDETSNGMTAEAGRLLLDIAFLILDGHLDSATLTDETIKAKVTCDRDGNLKFQRTDSITRVRKA